MGAGHRRVGWSLGWLFDSRSIQRNRRWHVREWRVDSWPRAVNLYQQLYDTLSGCRLGLLEWWLDTADQWRIDRQLHDRFAGRRLDLLERWMAAAGQRKPLDLQLAFPGKRLGMH